MAEKNFMQVGIIDAEGKFAKGSLRAQDVLDTKNVSVETHMNDAVIHLTSEQATLIANAIQNSEKGVPGGLATLDANGHLTPDQIDLTSYQVKVNAATYEAMIALDTTVKNGCPVNNYVFVTDATGDSTVESGWAIYRRVGAGNTGDDFYKTSEQESMDIVLPDFVAMDNRISANENAAQAAQSTADTAVANAASAQSAANTAQTTADSAVSAASTADGKAQAAQSTADTAVTNAANAQSTADSAANEAAKIDACYAESEADLATKNMRVGALCFMKVENS